MSCCDRSTSQTTHCLTSVEPVRDLGRPMPLIPIERAINCRAVVLPCAFTHKALEAAQFCLSCLRDPGSLDPTASAKRQFQTCCNDIGLIGCDSEVIQVPELWVQALEESIDRNGENFGEIYIRKLLNNA